MLLSLHVHQLALIEDVCMDFGEGMHVMTGETGAGKSIVVDSVNLVLGGRADRDLIRTGEDKAWVEACFDMPGSAVLTQLMSEQLLDFDGRSISLQREITRSGRNVCRVNGTIVPLSFLKAVADTLMDVHGQHEHTFLMDPDRHLSFLDASGDAAHDEKMAATAAAAEAFLKTHRAYAKLVRANEQKKQRMAELEAALAELKKAKPKPGEEQLLQEERDRSRNSQQIVDAVNEAASLLSAAGEDESVLVKLQQAASAMSGLKKLGGAYEELAVRAESLLIEAKELNYDLAAIMEDSSFDPERIEQVEKRLDLLRRLERRYGVPADDLAAEQAKLQEEYDRLSAMDDEVAAMQKKHRTLLAAYRAAARELTESRKALAKRFEQRLMAQLADLGLAKLVFEVRFAENTTGKPLMPRAVGDDTVEFMISPNPGEPLRALSKIASGGELSRIMLAIKTLEAEKTGVGTMVFDEIDTGISGRMAQAVAEKMATIAHKRQVVCVTHLPQLAAMADHQFLIEKRVDDGRTHTDVRLLDESERAGDIARMLSGSGGSDESAVEHAKHMRALAEAYKHSEG